MQSIVTPLLAVLTANTRVPRIRVKASWLKIADPNIVFAIVNSSLVDSSDLVAGQSEVITNSELFLYVDESQYAIRLDYDRRLDRSEERRVGKECRL